MLFCSSFFINSLCVCHYLSVLYAVRILFSLSQTFPPFSPHTHVSTAWDARHRRQLLLAKYAIAIADERQRHTLSRQWINCSLGLAHCKVVPNTIFVGITTNIQASTLGVEAQHKLSNLQSLFTYNIYFAITVIRSLMRDMNKKETSATVATSKVWKVKVASDQVLSSWEHGGSSTCSSHLMLTGPHLCTRSRNAPLLLGTFLGLYKLHGLGETQSSIFKGIWATLIV